MEIRVKLMGVLKAKEPKDNRMELSDGATVADVLDLLEIPDKQVHTFSVNGSFGRDKTQSLSAGDDLMVLAPVGGG